MGHDELWQGEAEQGNRNSPGSGATQVALPLPRHRAHLKISLTQNGNSTKVILGLRFTKGELIPAILDLHEVEDGTLEAQLSAQPSQRHSFV